MARESVERAYLQKVSKSRFAFGLTLCKVHGFRKVVYKVRVDLENNGFRKGGDKHVSYLLILEF